MFQILVVELVFLIIGAMQHGNIKSWDLNVHNQEIHASQDQYYEYKWLYQKLLCFGIIMHENFFSILPNPKRNHKKAE